MLLNLIKRRIDLSENHYPTMSTLPGAEDKQRQALLEFRAYSKRLLTVELEDFREGKLKRLSREMPLSGRIGTDRTFMGFLGALIVGTSNKENEGESLLKIFGYFFLIMGLFSTVVAGFAYVYPVFIAGEPTNLLDLSSYVLIVGVPTILAIVATFLYSPGFFRTYSYSMLLESPLPKILKAYDSLEENRTINSLNQLFFAGSSLPKLPESKEEVLSKDIYLILDKHLQDSAKELFSKLQISVNQDRLDWATCRDLYKDKISDFLVNDSETMQKYFFSK